MPKVQKSTIVLVLLLVFTNGFWVVAVAYQALDQGVTTTYMGDSIDDCHEAFGQLLAVTNSGALAAGKKGAVLAAAKAAAPGAEPFEKESYWWVGQLGFAFGESGELVNVRPSSSTLPSDVALGSD